jgi:hypothetical protein
VLLPLIRLTLAHNKFRFEILLPDLSSFFLNPAFEPDFLDPAEIVEFHVMWVLCGLVRDWR